MEVLSEGKEDYFRPDPDGFRAWVRDHKPRTLINKLMSEKEAISRFVSDGDYFAYDCNYFQRGPSSLIREVIRQQKKDLWICGKFTYVAVALLVDSGCASKVDIGFVGFGPWLSRAVAEGRVKTYEYSNVVMTYRLQAGAQGLPFIGVRSFGGTSGFEYSGAKIVKDPFTGQPVVLLPALNPDVAIIHVHQADVYGNARVYGTGIAHTDCALASKKVIISAEEIVETDEFRRDPSRTSIPHFVADAVVHAPYGAYPGTVQGYYASDVAHVVECFGGMMRGDLKPYLEKWVYSVGSHEETLEKRVGWAKLKDLKRRETIREGYGI
jgi:acyl CoA:acetate/3-ketoacid CoA transferase alpha subunit